VPGRREISMFEEMSPILLYAIIFVAKVIEVSMAVVRIILVNKGEKNIGSIIAFFEVLLWLVLVVSVLTNIQEDPVKMIVYAAGFAVGQFVGSIIEEKLAIGAVRIEVIVKEMYSTELSDYLRIQGFAVTTVRAQGMNFPRTLMILYIPRNKIKSVIKEIYKINDDAVITVDEVRPVHGGYNRMRRMKLRK
jgi:uncharacterized protein YebE (UPF0316 family)